MKARRYFALAGYTLIELLVVMAAIGLLLAIAAPRYTAHVDRARETVLRHNLQATREAIDKFYADHARYPKGLHELVEARYLRELPFDPITDRNNDWVLLKVTPGAADAAVRDLRSSAPGVGQDGTAYAAW